MKLFKGMTKKELSNAIDDLPCGEDDIVAFIVPSNNYWGTDLARLPNVKKAEHAQVVWSESERSFILIGEDDPNPNAVAALTIPLA